MEQNCRIAATGKLTLIATNTHNQDGGARELFGRLRGVVVQIVGYGVTFFKARHVLRTAPINSEENWPELRNIEDSVDLRDTYLAIQSRPPIPRREGAGLHT